MAQHPTNENIQVTALQHDFKDLTKSFLVDVLRANQNDPVRARAALTGFGDEAGEQQRQKITFLRNSFPRLSEVEIRAALEKCNWDEDQAIMPLFQLNEKAIQQENRRLQEQRQKQREDQKKQLIANFNGIAPEQIQKLLDDNEGDIEATTDELLKLIQKNHQEEERRNQQLRDRELTVTNLRAKLDNLSKEEVTKALEDAQWNVQTATTNLMKVSEQRKLHILQDIFYEFKASEVEDALVKANSQTIEAMKLLTALRETKRVQKEKEERLEKEEKDRVKREQEQAAATQRAEEQKKQETANEAAKQKEMEKNFLQRSMMIATEVQQQVKQDDQKLKELDREAFLKALDERLRLNIMPGFVPPTPKKIDELLGKPTEAPIAPKDAAEPVIAPVALPSIEELKQRLEEVKVSNSPISASTSASGVISLKCPIRADIGDKINVTYELVAGSTHSHDYVGLFPAGSTGLGGCISWNWRGKDASKGEIAFIAPSTFGLYEFRYITKEKEVLATSTPFVVGPEIELNAQIEGAKTLVRWTQKFGNAHSWGWIGLYEKNETNNKNYISYQYNSKSVDNTLTFNTPIKPGLYEFRYCPSGYVDISRSKILVIEGEDKISVVVEGGQVKVTVNVVTINPYQESAWIGLFFVGEANNRQYRRYKYFSSSNEVVTFKQPRTAGTYEARLFANKSYDIVIKRSQPFVLEATN